MKRSFLFFLLFCVATPQVSAKTAWQAFVNGDYGAAIDIGRHENTAESLTIACRSNLIVGGFLIEDRSAANYLHAAIRDCVQALQLDKTYFDAQISLAIALSFEGKRIKSLHYPRKARRIIERLIQTHPENAQTYGALAAWHSQVSAAGFFARLALKASRDQAAALFEEALGHGIIDFPLSLEQIKFLAQGSTSDRKEALKLAEVLMLHPTTTAFDQLLQKRSAILFNALKSGKKSDIKSAIQHVSAFSEAADWNDIDSFPKEDIPEN